MRAILCIVAVAPFVALAQSTSHMRILLNGTPVGENQFSRSVDGAVTSKSNLDLGSIKVVGSVTAHIQKQRLIDAVAENDGPGGKSTITFAKGRVTLTSGAKTAASSWQDKTGLWGANLHPQFFASTLAAAETQITRNPAVQTTTLSAYLVDAGAVLPLKVTMRQPVTVDVAGRPQKAKRFSVEVAGVTMEFVMDSTGNVVGQDVPVQHIRFVADGWENAFTDPIAKFPELSQATYKTRVERAVHVRMRDSVELICEVVRPDDDQKHPAILVRTPYGRGSEAAGGQFYASRGYAYIAQDCRGREDSYGEWDPFVNEGPDGYDTIQWIAAQPWCDGKVGMIGGSYAGYVQWAAAVLNPPALKCIVPQVSPPDAMRNIPYDHGVFFLYGDMWWAKIVAGRRTDFTTMRASLPHPEKLNTLPLADLDKAVLGQKLEFYDKWLSRPTIQDWRGMDFTYHLANANVPALHISGTWDGDEIGTHINWSTLRALKRDNQWIVFGPWVHAFNTNHSFADVEYGPDAIIDLDSMFLRWFDTWLKGKSVGFDKKPRAQVFVTGANKWIDLPDWPAEATPSRTLYLSKRGLSESKPAEDSKTYVYDPARDSKVPQIFLDLDPTKATTKVDGALLKAGLYLSTEPLKSDTAVSGPIRVDLDFSSSAADTDFFAQVVDVDAGGTARIVGQPGKIRCSYLGGMDAVRPLEPGKRYLATVEPWDFAHEFKKGHRLGLVVVSSMFPSYARNLGTAEPIKSATRMVAQRNTIYFGGNTPSSLTFHVLWER